MSDNFEALFDLAASGAPAVTHGPPDGTTSTHAPPASANLPPLSSFGRGIVKELRPSGNTEHEFVAFDTHVSKDSATITAVMISAPSTCGDTRLQGSFAVFQATAPEFIPAKDGTTYETGRDKHIRSDGGARTVNTMDASSSPLLSR